MSIKKSAKCCLVGTVTLSKLSPFTNKDMFTEFLIDI